MNSNPFSNLHPETQPPLEIDRAVDRLADLLADTPEVRELIRAAQEVKNDPDVIRIARAIKDLKTAEGNDTPFLLETLRQEQERVIPVRQFRQAEANLRALFSGVDKIISSSAGLNFSENARANIRLWDR
jgi:cell fate (sporulation/competence/biofilm development) regulator YlbF (YheA/YmcA/DUF963 family)